MASPFAFPPHEGLPFEPNPPTIDGYVEPEQPGVNIPHPREIGYTHGARFSYGDGAGSGVAVTALNGIKHNSQDLLYLGFVVRYDFTLDAQDRIVVVLRDAFTPPAGQSGNVRRIDIAPLLDNSGAQGPDDQPSQPGQHVRTNKSPKELIVYQPNTAGSTPVWTRLQQPPAGLQARVRSVHVDGTSPGSSPAYYWSVELQVPTRKAAPNDPNDPWIDLLPSFGLYTNVIRVCSTCPTGVIIDGFASAQFTWPLDPANPEALTIHDGPQGQELTPENWSIPADWLGEAYILASGAKNPALGVKFQGGIAGIGVLQPGGVIGDTVDMTAAGKLDTMVGRVINDDQASSTPQIHAEFRIADFGIGGGMPGVWDLIPSTPNPSAAKPVPPPAGNAAPTPVDLVSNWTISDPDRTKYQQLWTDQCLWVLLDSTGGPVNIVEASMRRNLTVHTMSDYAGGFTISGQGYPSPAGGKGHHDFLLHTVTVPLQLTRESPPESPQGPDLQGIHPLLREAVPERPSKPVATWLWVTNGYRSTDRSLTIKGRKYAVLVHAGSFGHLFNHELQPGESLDSVALDFDFDGGGIERPSGTLAAVRVPEGGSVTVRTRFTAGRPQPGCLPLGWLRRLLLAIIRWLRKLLGR